MASPYEKILNVMTEVKGIVEEAKANGQDTNLKLAEVSAKLDNITKLAEKHERVLYRQNGNPGLIDIVEDLKEAENERKKDKDQQRNFRLGLYSAIILMVIDLTLRLLGVA